MLLKGILFKMEDNLIGILTCILFIIFILAILIKKQIALKPIPYKKLPEYLKFGITDKVTHDRLVWAGIISLSVAATIAIVNIYFFNVANAFNNIAGVATLVAFLLAIVGIAQQYEILQQQRELHIIQQSRLETSIPKVLKRTFNDLTDYGFRQSDEVHALLASPAFGVLGEPSVFEAFVEMIEDWLKNRGDSKCELTLYLWEKEEHILWFGEKTGAYNEKIYANEGHKKQNLNNIAWFVALWELSSKRKIKLDFNIFQYYELTDFRMILAKGKEKHLSVVMAFSDKYRGNPKVPIATRELDCLTTFGSAPNAFRKAEEVLKKYCPNDRYPVDFDRNYVAVYFDLIDHQNFFDLVQEKCDYICKTITT
ncbi:MAG: hypothetical protein JJE30_18050 [Desulfuromonadales bacterium]|nr:hypothetical protein [Desulfuromonadales bacterium]